MSGETKLEGMEEVESNLNAELSQIAGRSLAGLFAAGLKVQAESQRRVPVEHGNLRASAYTRKAVDDPAAVEVGYSAAYAVFVHENLEQKLKGRPRPSGLGQYWGPNGQPKFLESAARDLNDEIVRTVAAYAADEV